MRSTAFAEAPGGGPAYAQERSNLKRRLKRQARRKSARIVNLQRARPWELEQVSRSTWYARHRNRHEHQLLGLHSLLLRGDAAAVADAQREITLRAQSSQSQVLKDMQVLLKRPDLNAKPPLLPSTRVPRGSKIPHRPHPVHTATATGRLRPKKLASRQDIAAAARRRHRPPHRL
jgi:hypothetical protein